MIIKTEIERAKKAYTEWQNRNLSDYGLIKTQQEALFRIEKKLEQFGLLDDINGKE